MKHPEDLPGGRNAQKSINNNNSNNQISHPKADEPLAQKRSNVMNATTVISRGIITLISILFLVGVTYGQNLNLKGAGSTDMGGTWNVKGDINTTDAGGAYKFTGTVNLNGTGSGTQTIANGGGAATARALEFNILNAGPGGTGKAFASGGIVTVDGAFTLNTDNLKSYTVGAHTLSFGSTVTQTSGLFDATDVGSVVNFTSSDEQLIFKSTYGGTLGLSNGAKIMAASGSYLAAKVDQPSGSITISRPLTITGATASQLHTITNITSDGSLTLNNASGTLSIATLSGNNATIDAGPGAITFSQTGPIANTGDMTASTGTLAFGGDITIGSAGALKSLTISGAGTAKFAGSVTLGHASSVFTFANLSTAEYNGASPQTIVFPTSGAYYKLTLTGDSKKTAPATLPSNTLTLNTLTINGFTSLDMGATNSLSATTYALNQVEVDSTKWAKVIFGGSNGTAISQGIVDYSGTGVTIKEGTYNMLVLSGTGNKTIADNKIVSTSRSLIVDSGNNLIVGDAGTNATALNVAWTLSLAGTLNNKYANSTITIGESFDVTGAVTNVGTINVGN